MNNRSLFAADTLIDIPLTAETRGRKRAYHQDKASTSLERSKAHKQKARDIKLDHIGIIDFETDPFDKDTQTAILPFAACIYTEHFAPIMIWEDDFDSFVQRLFAELDAIKEPFTFYAHNGGKFDYLFIVHKLRGKVSFKGRGLMSARIGIHEIRDSFHIIPEKLAAYRKDAFDYAKMRKDKRQQFKQEINEYLLADCVYLYDIVKSMVTKFGMKLSIGQMAMAELKKHYKPQSIGANTDASLRQWFFGGRVECLKGRGYFVGDYKLYDVNSMYPSVMARFAHPISSNYTLRRKGEITEKTVFLEIECENHGALVRRGENNETSANIRYGTFLTTIWEFETALELGLIDRVKIKGLIDNDQRTTFENVIVPMYEARQKTKAILATHPKLSKEYYETKKEDMFYKFLLNNMYGKFAQNPRNYRETFITDPGGTPDEKEWSGLPKHGDWLLKFQNPIYWIWEKPEEKLRFNNVGTAASITGAARSILMRAIHSADDPIYCDTDSLICKNLSGVEINKVKLGAWDLEDEFSEVIICGKKQYACKPKAWNGQMEQIKIRSKGTSGVTWDNMLEMLAGKTLEFINPAPTLTKFGKQYYTTRNIRATAPIIEASL